MFKKLLVDLELNPKKLFLFDAFGAYVTALMLGLVLVRFESFFGIPPSALYILAAIPMFYVLYDLAAYFFSNEKNALFLKGIALLNLLYCFISVGMAINHAETITSFGWIYIIVEVIIIVVLSIFELKVAKKLLS